MPFFSTVRRSIYAHIASAKQRLSARPHRTSTKPRVSLPYDAPRIMTPTPELLFTPDDGLDPNFDEAVMICLALQDAGCYKRRQ